MFTFVGYHSTDMATSVYKAMAVYGREADSRNGRVLKFDCPVMLEYMSPMHRANFTPGRDSNPFFHIAEAAWMLAGRNDVQYLDLFNKGMKQYSDDGHTFNAAYGHRMRHHFGYDQLEQVVKILQASPDSRQAIVQLWDSKDNTILTADKACNMSLVFQVMPNNKLSLMVYNRSNDAVFGNVTGANPVHMSFFQQYVADKLGLRMGSMYFTTTNLHVYLDLYDHWQEMDFSDNIVVPHSYWHSDMGDLEEFELLCKHTELGVPTTEMYESKYIEDVVKPIINCWLYRKMGDHFEAAFWLAECKCEALRANCLQWIERKSSL